MNLGHNCYFLFCISLSSEVKLLSSYINSWICQCVLRTAKRSETKSEREQSIMSKSWFGAADVKKHDTSFQQREQDLVALPPSQERTSAVREWGAGTSHDEAEREPPENPGDDLHS